MYISAKSDEWFKSWLVKQIVNLQNIIKTDNLLSKSKSRKFYSFF